MGKPWSFSKTKMLQTQAYQLQLKPGTFMSRTWDSQRESQIWFNRALLKKIAKSIPNILTAKGLSTLRAVFFGSNLWTLKPWRRLRIFGKASLGSRGSLASLSWLARSNTSFKPALKKIWREEDTPSSYWLVISSIRTLGSESAAKKLSLPLKTSTSKGDLFLRRPTPRRDLFWLSWRVLSLQNPQILIPTFTDLWSRTFKIY